MAINVIYSELSSKEFQWLGHHYLNLHPTQNYKRGLTYYNSLGFRIREFLESKPDGAIFVLDGSGGSIVRMVVMQRKRTVPEKIFNRFSL